MNRSEMARRKVRDCAGDLLVNEGVPAFTVDEIARRSGVAKTTIYRHWPSVHALLVDTVACQIEDLATPDMGSLRSDLQALYEYVIPTADFAGRRRMMLGIMQASADDPDLQTAMAQLLEQRQLPLRNVIERALQRGEITRALDIDRAVDIVEGPLIFRFLMRGEPYDVGALGALLDVVVAGLTAPA